LKNRPGDTHARTIQSSPNRPISDLKVSAQRRSQTAAKRTSNLNAAPSRSFSQAAVTSNFLSICRDAIHDKTKVYVSDRAGQFYLTLDPVKRYLEEPIIDVSAQFFKDNFSRFSSLIKDGLCFRLSHRGSKAVIYARRHTKHRDPLDHVIEQWREQVAASTKQQEEQLLLAIKAISRQNETQTEAIEAISERIRQIMQGMARLAIGHRPFEVGMSENIYRAIDEAPPQ
jgi:hypothetical protein